MAKDLSKTEWHGIPRTDIPWFPTINDDKCIGCQLCYVSCGREVFEFDDDRRKAVVERKYNCLVGCTTCATICPAGAIDFPPKDFIQKLEKEYKILKVVRETAKEKKTKKEYEEARAKAAELLNKVVTAVEFEVTGHFAERQIMAKFYNAIKNDPCDVIYISIETPSLKDCWKEQAPSYAKFRLVSTEYADITPYAEKIKQVLKDNNVVLVAERKTA